MQIFKNPNFDFVRWRWHAMALSLIIILAGAFNIWRSGPRLGVDFAGGTIVILKFDQNPTPERVRTALAQLPAGGDAIVQQYGDPANRDVLIRVRRTGEETAGNLSREADAVVAAVRQAALGNFTVVGTEIVGPVVGEQLKRQGLMATVLALGGILAYIALRFQFSFAIGAIVLSALALLNREVRVLAESFDSAFRLSYLPPGDALAVVALAGLLGWLGAHLSVSKHLREMD